MTALSRTQKPVASVFRRLLLLLLFLALPAPSLHAQSEVEPSVQAILFYSPTCPHCHQVLTEVLQPLAEQYGEQLQIMAIDTTQEAGQYLYQKGVAAFEVPEELWVVPMLFVEELVLVGTAQIEAQFPELIEEGLAADGIGWPAIPELTTIIPDLPPSSGPGALPSAPEGSTPSATTVAEPTMRAAPAAPAPTATTRGVIDTPEPAGAILPQSEPTSTAEAAAAALPLIGLELDALPAQEPPPDPVGFAIGWTVLLLLLVGLIFGLRQIFASRSMLTAPAHSSSLDPDRKRLLIFLIAAGLLASVYLTYVEITQVKAACGPIGNCNIVQNSQYARILGLPVALLGTLYYLALTPLLFVTPPAASQLALIRRPALLILSLIGVLFSMYLTGLELLVIHAVCAYCLTSALVCGALFFLITHHLQRKGGSGSLRLRS